MPQHHKLIRSLVAALRAERERADMLEEQMRYMERRMERRCREYEEEIRRLERRCRDMEWDHEEEIRKLRRRYEGGWW